MSKTLMYRGATYMTSYDTIVEKLADLVREVAHHPFNWVVEEQTVLNQTNEPGDLKRYTTFTLSPHVYELYDPRKRERRTEDISFTYQDLEELTLGLDSLARTKGPRARTFTVYDEKTPYWYVLVYLPTEADFPKIEVTLHMTAQERKLGSFDVKYFV